MVSRQDFEFDEHFYVRKYPDVLKAVQDGKFASGRVHYEKFGAAEGRDCNAIASELPRVFIAGAYGTRNVGDEAIFDGARVIYPNAIQLYINAPRNLPAVEVYSMLRGPNKFRSQDTLIIGGGGLLYDRGAVRVLVDLCRKARAAGATVRIERIGCEAARPEFYTEVRELFALADAVSVRSTISQQMAHDITGREVQRAEDFATELAPRLPQAKRRSSEIPLIGVVTGGDHQEDITPLIDLIKRFSSDRATAPVRFVHIPHSASHIGIRNNDEIVGMNIAVQVDLFLEGRMHGFQRLPYSDEPLDVLQTYARLDGLISRRFHGLVFAHMMRLPTLALPGDGQKNTSFIEDHRRENLIAVDDLRQIDKGFAALMQSVPR